MEYAFIRLGRRLGQAVLRGLFAKVSPRTVGTGPALLNLMAEPHAPKRLYDLLAQAETMLRCGPEFWLGLGFGSETHQHLAAAARNLRERECAFCLLLSERIDLMVQRQALDREAWELISLCRTRLKTTLGSQWSTRWAPAGFAEGTLKIPERSEERLVILRRLGEYFRIHPEQQPDSVPGASRRPEVLLEEMATLLGRIEDCRHLLRNAVRARRNALAVVRQLTREAARQVHDRLRQADLRWQSGCFVTTAGEKHTAVRHGLPCRLPSSRHAGSSPAIVRRYGPGIELQGHWTSPVSAARRLSQSAGIPQRAAGCTGRTVASAAVGNARSVVPMNVASSPQPVLLGKLNLASVIAWLFPPAS